MAFDLTVPQSASPESPLSLSIGAGEMLFLLGANGTGKSGLMQRFFRDHHASAKWMSAYRQTWFSSDISSLSPHGKRQIEATIQSSDTSPHARWRHDYSQERASISIANLVDAENVRARSIADAVDKKDISLAQTFSQTNAPIKIINELLRLSNLPIQIAVLENDQVVASKYGGVAYSIAELSDGERNALLIAAEVLTAKPGTLLLIDEPDRHLHRSIISPLITELFSRRSDCAFIVSTHDITLPLDNPRARTLLVRDCTFTGPVANGWNVDVLPPEAKIDDVLKKDILGARRKVLFTEGDEQSLDKPLYSLLFPNVSVIAKSSCNEVEKAVSGLRGADDLHWVRAFGIVDNDRKTSEDVSRLQGKGVYSVSVFSVESIYYHSEILRRVAERHAGVTGEDAAARLLEAKKAAIAAVRPQVQRLSERTVEKLIREEMCRQLPGQKEIAAGGKVQILADIDAFVTSEQARLETAVAAGDLQTIIAHYPVRETGALTEIARKLGFQDRDQYESAVLKLLMDDEDALKFVRSLFGTLVADISAA